MVKKRQRAGPVRPLSERVRIAREINVARAANPRMTVSEVIALLGYDDVSEKSYWPWRKRLQMAEATGEIEQHNGEQHAAVEHFPLAIIPAREPSKPKTTAPRVRDRPREDDDKAIVASLLEVAARLLRR